MSLLARQEGRAALLVSRIAFASLYELIKRNTTTTAYRIPLSLRKVVGTR